MPARKAAARMPSLWQGLSYGKAALTTRLYLVFSFGHSLLVILLWAFCVGPPVMSSYMQRTLMCTT
jgi:hypothetical protein